MSIHDFYAKGCDAKGLGAYLDGLTAEQRLAEVRALSGRQQAALFEAAQGLRPLSLGDFVPAGIRPKFAERLAITGIQLPVAMFDVPMRR